MPPRYSYRVAWSDEDNAWIAISPEWRFLSADGPAPQDAMVELDTAIAGAIEAFAAEGWEPPKPMLAEDEAFSRIEIGE